MENFTVTVKEYKGVYIQYWGVSHRGPILLGRGGGAVKMCRLVPLMDLKGAI